MRRRILRVGFNKPKCFLSLRNQLYSSTVSAEDKRKIIERIRELYGIGFTLDDARGRDALQNYQTQQAGSLKLLSKELYSIQTHFVLEYIQNADDNKYNPGISAELYISYNGDSIDFCNNERGFSEKDVRALCAVGQSTKDVKGGYIGEKGIGFKAGFTIANRIQVHSNDFHFEFEESAEIGALGFVVPKWVDETPNMGPYTTLIRLFLKPSVKKEDLLRQLQDTTQPELLLFLRQLRTLNLKVGDQLVSTKRTDNASGDVTLDTTKVIGDSSERSEVNYFTYKHTVETPRHVSRGRGSEATDILIAFPSRGAQTQKVFAYLPVKDYGLKFLLNADFYLASSREFIAEDNEWNLWIRSHVAAAFVNGFQDYLKKGTEGQEASTSGRQSPYPYHYWEFIPLLGEADEFFAPVADQIWKVLSLTPCMLSELGGYVAPSSLLFPPDGELASLISNADLYAATGRQFLLSGPQKSLVLSDRLRRVFRQLGMRDFTATDLIEILKMDGFLASKGQDSKWFMRLYKYIAQYLQPTSGRRQSDSDDGGSGEPVVNVALELSKLPLVLLHSGKTVSATSGAPVYFFPHSANYGFEQELLLVHREVGENLTCVEVLETLGVQYTDRDMIIERHILPQLSKGKITSLPGYIAYLADFHSSAKPKIWERLKAVIKLRDRKKTLRAPSSLVLPDSLNTVKTEELLGLNRVTYLDDSFVMNAIKQMIASISALSANTTVDADYIKETDWSQGSPGTILHDVAKGIRTTDAKTPLQMETEKWTEFLIKLGVSQLYSFERKDCPTFPMVVNGVLNTHGKPGLEKLLTLTSKLWSTMAEQAVPGSDGRPSAFVTRLRSTPWVVTQSGKVVAPDTTRVWLKETAVVELFGEAVEYCVAPISVECATAMGINAVLTPAAVLSELPKLPMSDPALFARVYRYLYREFRGHSVSILCAFRDVGLIWACPSERLLKLSEVVWRDPTDLVSTKVALAPIYRDYADLQSFFVGDLHVSPEPTPADYMTELTLLAQPTTGTTTAPDASKAVVLYEQLAELLSSGVWMEETHAAWKDLRRSTPLFAVRGPKAEWVKAEECYVEDDPLVGKHIESRGEVKFLDIPHNRIPKLKHFLQESEIPFVSQSMRQERMLQTDAQGAAVGVADVALTSQVRQVVALVKRNTYFRHTSTYMSHREVFRKLQQVSVVRVPKVIMRCSACGVTWDKPEHCVVEGSTVYVSEGCPDWAWHAAVGEACGVDPLVVYALASAKSEARALLDALQIDHLPLSEQ